MTLRRLLSAHGAAALLSSSRPAGSHSASASAVVCAASTIARKAEREATVAALKPASDPRPLIAIIGINGDRDHRLPDALRHPQAGRLADVMTAATAPAPSPSIQCSRSPAGDHRRNSTRGARAVPTMSSCPR